MTDRDVVLTHAAPTFGTTRVGEAMASAPGSRPPVEALVPALRRLSGPLVLVLVLGFVASGCNAGASPSVGPPLPGPVAAALADPSRDLPEPSTGAAAFYAGLFADTIAGDMDRAAASYERALGDARLGAVVATHAALRWAVIEAASGRSRRSIELVARANAVADGDPVLTDRADRLQGAITSLGPATIEVRGPPLGSTIPGDAATAARFARAEALLARAHRLRPRSVIQALSTSIRGKELATEAAARAYREVAATGPAAIAADYRIGSAYHDLALALVFELPPELDPGVAAQLRRTLRGSALAYLRKAVVAYRRALDPPAEGAELWVAAARSDLRAALDLLGEP